MLFGCLTGWTNRKRDFYWFQVGCKASHCLSSILEMCVILAGVCLESLNIKVIQAFQCPFCFSSLLISNLDGPHLSEEDFPPPGSSPAPVAGCFPSQFCSCEPSLMAFYSQARYFSFNLYLVAGSLSTSSPCVKK